jgi:hypothetical protein
MSAALAIRFRQSYKSPSLSVVRHSPDLRARTLAF